MAVAEFSKSDSADANIEIAKGYGVMFHVEQSGSVRQNRRV